MEKSVSYEKLKIKNKFVWQYFEVLNQRCIALIGDDEELKSVESEIEAKGGYKIKCFSDVNKFLNTAYRDGFDLVVFSNEQDFLKGERLIAEEVNTEIISLPEIIDKLLRY